jgi:hypothetical protein
MDYICTSDDREKFERSIGILGKKEHDVHIEKR